MTLKPKRQKRCKACLETFYPRATTQKACSINCAQKLVKADQQRALKADSRKRRQAIKGHREWLREAQAAFNRFVRVRDYGRPCISSGREMDWEGKGITTGSRVDAGHYRSTGAASHLRFNLWNCHAQSVRDNRDLSGNAVDYRIGLIERIGLERVEALEGDNEPRRFDIDYLKRVKSIFTRRARLYERLRQID